LEEKIQTSIPRIRAEPGFKAEPSINDATRVLLGAVT
jgi:hypothetical protein